MNAYLPKSPRNLLTQQEKALKMGEFKQFQGHNLSRILFCDSSLRAKLHYAHIDAIELGCADCSFDLVEDQPLEAIVQELQEDPDCFYITDPMGLLDACSKFGHTLNERTILLLSEKDNQLLAPISNLLGALRFVLGAPNPSLLRGFIASILECHLSGQIRGIVPRLLKPDGLQSKQFVLTESASRSKVQESVVEFFAEQLQFHKSTLVTGISSYPKYLGDVVDEFLMNAIWDAHPSRRTMDRSSPPPLTRANKLKLNACVMVLT